ncbi:MAG: hypothetical protein ACREH8_16695 [Opitutaceae bacterium]
MAHYASLLRADVVNVFTLHAEIEGVARRKLFRELLTSWVRQNVGFVRLDEYARALLSDRPAIPVCEQVNAQVDGRSGLVAAQRE